MAPRINIPPLTRFLLITCIALTISNAIIRPYTDLQAPLTRIGVGAPYLSIVPGQSIIYPWVFFTATLVEQNIFGLIISGLTLFYGGRYLERAWGSAEFGKFILVTTLIPNLLTFGTLVSLFVLSRHDGFLTATISGALPLQASFLVSLKQLVPEHTVSLFRSLIRIRVKHFPAIFLLVNTIAAIVLGTYTALLLSWYGFFTSWIYLRFFRVSPSTLEGQETTVKGDASDTFAFPFFFPEPIHTPLAAICDRIYEALVAMRVCTPFSAADIESGNAQASARSEGGLPSIMNPRGGRGWAGETECYWRKRTGTTTSSSSCCSRAILIKSGTSGSCWTIGIGRNPVRT
ncbi:cytochrome c oxidase subunit I [Rhizodiscina lignyota]|uniref:Cytochrome c oxidase subunit I n=1 Tax=Rhizodiscina lignyota TaxID=1504668 RepID=A0A9P4M868_9PEZI|nr:cytochrome c oxidase subunit I [Rhizodiscina lignyota]